MIFTQYKFFDIYNIYDGINNLKTVNDQAGITPVKVDGAIIELLSDCVAYYDLTGGRVNVAMGSVLKLWHNARTESLENPENAYIPAPEALAEAAKHTDIENLIIDKENSTVFLKDSQMSLDVGAIAKGWAAQRAAASAPEDMLLSLGGNVVATGPKGENTPWTVGVQDPRGAEIRHKLPLSKGSVVTSGDYQRTFTVDGKEFQNGEKVLAGKHTVVAETEGYRPIKKSVVVRAKRKKMISKLVFKKLPPPKAETAEGN